MTIRRTLRAASLLLTAWYAVLASVSAAAREPAPGSAALPEPTLLVFAAASLTDALEEVDRAFTRDTHIGVQSSYAASSVLARQIEAGAHADVFFSADRDWMDYLDKRGLLRAGTRRDVVGNSLVLVAPADSTVHLAIAPGFALAAALGDGHLAMGDPDSVPAGLYGRAALTRLGVWDAVAPRVARAENVRTALAYVARGESPLGIVYQTDALADKRVRVVDVFPADTHPPIVYPAAATAAAKPESGRYLDFLRGNSARQIFARYGFRPLT